MIFFLNVPPEKNQAPGSFSHSLLPIVFQAGRLDKVGDPFSDYRISFPVKPCGMAEKKSLPLLFQHCFAPGPNPRNGSEKPGAGSGRIAAVVSWMNSTSLLSLSGEKNRLATSLVQERSPAGKLAKIGVTIISSVYKMQHF
ncbi:MAG: hypothetical protein AB1426_08615 [Bacillota bacterium]